MRLYNWDPWRTAASDPDRLAVVADDESATFGELADRADRIAVGLRQAGVPDGGLITTDLPCGPDFYGLALAAIRYGFILLPVKADTFSRTDPSERPEKIHLHVGEVSEVFPLAFSTERLVAEGGESIEPARRAGHIEFVTSGTTGAPTIIRRARHWYSYRGVTVDEKYAAGTGFGPHIMANATYHLGTIGPALHALQAGSGVIVQRRWSPAGFVELTDRHRADSAFLSPDRLLGLVEHGHWPRHRPRKIIHGGAACPPLVKRQAIDLMGPVLHEFYGTSDCVISEITADEWLSRPGSVGRALPGVCVAAVVGDDEVQPYGEIGEIRVQPRAVDRKHAGRRFGLRTGDLGYVDDEGYIFLLGRAGDGHSAATARFEHAVRSLPGVADIAVASGEAGAECLVETLAGHPRDLSAQIRELADFHSIRAIVIELGPVGQFSRTASGKLARSR